MPAHLTNHEINYAHSLSDARLAALPLISAHQEPQTSPQEYECGCVTVTRITDRDARRGEYPFEMRLAVHCETADCEINASLKVSPSGHADDEFMRWCETRKACRYCDAKFYGPVCGCERLGP